MNTFSLHVWREWREHRFALLTLALVLPFGTWLLGLPLSRGTVNDPLFRSAAALGFAIVLLVAVGGELLGIERRGAGLRWLERLPSGLAVAFRAKLAFFLLTMTFVVFYGYGAGWLVGCLRPTHVAGRSQYVLIPCELLAVAVGLWTFAASAWTLRGGLALLAAALILGVLGYPVWRVVDAGYRPNLTELCTVTVMLVPGALLSAWLAFLHGARLGRGVLGAALCGLAPTIPMLAAVTSWSVIRLAEREVFDPRSKDFHVDGRQITEDGRIAFLIGSHRPLGWKAEAMPRYLLRVDLEHGSFEKLGLYSGESRTFHDLIADTFVFSVEERTQPLAFDAVNGEPRAWDAKQRKTGGWNFAGLGLYVEQGAGKPDLIRDPFRGREYPASDFGDLHFWSDLLVRPGLWLCSPSHVSWSWLDPDTKERTAVDWPEHSRPLVLFADGRILLGTETELRLLNPELDTWTVLDCQGINPAHVEPNDNGLRVPFAHRDTAATTGTIILRISGENDWLILDEDATSVRRLPIPHDFLLLRRLGADKAIVQGRYLARLDLVSGELTRLWPPAPTN